MTTNIFYKSLFLIFGIVVSLSGCIVKEKIEGKYASPKVAHVFQFKSDSTFFYEFHFGHSSRYSAGRWRKIKGDKLLLNSDIKNVSIITKVNNVSKRDNDGKKIAVSLQIDNGLLLKNYRCFICFNGKQVEERRCDSVQDLYINSSVKNIQFQFQKLPLEESIYRTETLNSDILNVEKFKGG